jgi:hypothetical protein
MTSTPGPWAYDGIRVYAPAEDEQYTVRFEDGTEAEHRRGLIALVYSCGDGSADANARVITAAPLMLSTLKAVWQLAHRLDIGNAERVQFRDLVAAVIDEAEGRAQAVTP